MRCFFLCDSNFLTATHIQRMWCGVWTLETCVQIKTRKLTWHPVEAKTHNCLLFRYPPDLSHSKIIAQKRNGTTEPFRTAKHIISDRISNCFNFNSSARISFDSTKTGKWTNETATGYKKILTMRCAQLCGHCLSTTRMRSIDGVWSNRIEYLVVVSIISSLDRLVIEQEPERFRYLLILACGEFACEIFGLARWFRLCDKHEGQKTTHVNQLLWNCYLRKESVAMDVDVVRHLRKF